MLRFFSSLSALLLCLGLALSAMAAGPTAPLKDGPIGAALARDYPQIGTEVITINPTPLPDLYEVHSRKGLLYYFPEQGYIFVGELYDKTGKSLTRETQERLMQEKLASLPLDKALKIGSGPQTVIEFTDPDCPYCRRGAAYFANRTDVTRYIYFFPLAMHKNAAAKSRFVLSAADPAKAYEEVMTGKYDQGPLPPFKDNGLGDEQKTIGDKFGISSTPIYFVNGQTVRGANAELLDKLLGPSPAPAPKTGNGPAK